MTTPSWPAPCRLRCNSALPLVTAPGKSRDLFYTFTQAWSDGTRGIKLSLLERLEKLSALVPPPRVHQMRSAGGVAAHSQVRGTIPPTPRQKGIETQASPASSRVG